MLINTNNFSDISNFINSLSYVDFEKIVKEYSIVNNINYDMTLNKMITVNLEAAQFITVILIFLFLCIIYIFTYCCNKFSCV